MLKLNDLYQLEHRTTVRVTYHDTDQMGHVYYANHLVWFEIGRTELCRAMGLPYSELEGRGVFLPVASAQVNYRAPARYDDLVEIRTRVARLSHFGIQFSYQVVRTDPDGETRIADGSTRHPFVGRDGKILKTGFEILGVEKA